MIKEPTYPNDDYSRFSAPDYRESDSKTPGETINLGNFKFDESEFHHPFHRSENFVGKGPKGYHPTDDRIHENVCDKLWQSPEVDASDIEVKVQEGCVTLTGKVSSRMEKKMAERLVEMVPGVVDIFNELRFDRH